MFSGSAFSTVPFSSLGTSSVSKSETFIWNVLIPVDDSIQLIWNVEDFNANIIFDLNLHITNDYELSLEVDKIKTLYYHIKKLQSENLHVI